MQINKAAKLRNGLHQRGLRDPNLPKGREGREKPINNFASQKKTLQSASAIIYTLLMVKKFAELMITGNSNKNTGKASHHHFDMAKDRLYHGKNIDRKAGRALSEKIIGDGSFNGGIAGRIEGVKKLL